MDSRNNKQGSSKFVRNMKDFGVALCVLVAAIATCLNSLGIDDVISRYADYKFKTLEHTHLNTIITDSVSNNDIKVIFNELNIINENLDQLNSAAHRPHSTELFLDEK